MCEMETSLHLYQPPLYRATGGIWEKSFAEALRSCNTTVTWDISAILSILSFGYTCGDRTLINEVSRRPWLSEVGPDGQPQLKEIPKHGRRWESAVQIAGDLNNLLTKEALRVCEGRKEIYLLLSGGLDSRIVAGILAKLYHEGRLAAKPVGVTWGLDDSRDVVYGRMVADILGLGWIHVNIGAEDLVRNIEEMAFTMGTLVSPIHIHCMHWFKNVSKEALILAGSYGDSIGRAEFSGYHLLELDYLQPKNTFGLMCKEVLKSAYDGVVKDIKALHGRSTNQARYVICEHEMQGHYMRNMISQAMSVIIQYCPIYQMFTHPEVYQYMWSIHPALRNNNVYAELLERLNPRLARLPWARTNKALRGRTIGASSRWRKDFHNYAEWIKGPLFDELNCYIDPEWFAETGIFNPCKIRNLVKQARIPYDIWLWLAAFRRMAEYIENLGGSIGLASGALNNMGEFPHQLAKKKRDRLRLILRNCVFLHRWVTPCRKFFRKIRRFVVKCQAILKYPPYRAVKSR